MTNTGKKIVLVINDLQAGGAERVVLNLYDEFAKQGHKPCIIYFKTNTLLTDGHRNIINLPKPSWLKLLPKPLQYRIFCRIFDRFVSKHLGRPNLILSNLTSADRVLCHSRLQHVHFVVHTMMSAAAKVKNIADRKKFRKKFLPIYSKKPVITVSQGAKDDFSEFFPEISDVKCIYNGVNVEVIKKEALAFEPELDNYIIHVGRFKRVKRHDLLIDAYAKSGIKQPLVLLGDGPLKQQCQEQVAALGLQDQVFFWGVKKNPFPYIAKASCLVVSSDYEGLSMVILEALALNIPVISTDCPTGPREVLPEHNLVAVDDAEKLAGLLQKTMTTPEFYKTALEPSFTVEWAARAYLALC